MDPKTVWPLPNSVSKRRRRKSPPILKNVRALVPRQVVRHLENIFDVQVRTGRPQLA